MSTFINNINNVWNDPECQISILPYQKSANSNERLITGFIWCLKTPETIFYN